MPESADVPLTATVLARTVRSRRDRDQPESGRTVYRYLLRLEPADGTARTVVIEAEFWLLELKPGVGDDRVGVQLGADGLCLALRGDPRYDADALIGCAAAHRRALVSDAGTGVGSQHRGWHPGGSQGDS